MILPIQSRLLVELKGAYDNISTTEEKFSNTKTRGLVRAVADDIKDQCAAFGIIVDKSMVYFGKYEDNAPCEINGKAGTLIKLEEIGGVENAGN